MPRVNYVKAARKDNPVCKKGESYYWWKFRYGGKHFSLTRPRPSQLTGSAFLSGMYAAQEQVEDCETDNVEDLQTLAEEIAADIEALGEEASDNRMNMPDHLQDGDTGCMLEERYDTCQEMAQTLQSIDFSDIDEDQVRQDAKDEEAEDEQAYVDEKRQERVDELKDEVLEAAAYEGE